MKKVIFALLAALASAKDCADYGAASSFNAVLFGDYSAAKTDVEGKMAVQGNFQVSDYSAGLLVPGKCADYGLLVGGTLTMNRGSISVKSTSKNAPVLTDVNLPCGAPEVRDPRFDFNAAKSTVNALSARFAALSSTGTAQQADKTVTFTFSGSNEIEVFNIQDPLFFQGQGNTILDVKNVRSDSLVVFNIKGSTTGLLDLNTNALLKLNGVVFNFPDATMLTLKNLAVIGDVLAPKAAITADNGVVRGKVIATSMTGQFQINTTAVPQCSSPPVYVPPPKPVYVPPPKPYVPPPKPYIPPPKPFYVPKRMIF